MNQDNGAAPLFGLGKHDRPSKPLDVAQNPPFRLLLSSGKGPSQIQARRATRQQLPLSRQSVYFAASPMS